MHSTTGNILYTGADLHGNNVFLSICNEAGDTVFRRRVKANLEAVECALNPYRDQIEIVGVESTYNWYWFVDGLIDKGFNVKLGNPSKMKQYEGIKVTNDLTDAAWLAEQLRLGIFPECYIYPKEIRPARDALRRRQQFVQRRTQAILSFMGILARYGLESVSARTLTQWTHKDIKSLSQEPHVQLQFEVLLEAIHSSDRLARRIEQEVSKILRPTKQYKRAQKVPGVGLILAMFIVLESGDFGRFASAGNYASYCRTVKSERSSNKKKKGENNSKNGNKYLAWAFIEAATFAVRFNPVIQAWYDRKRARTCTVKAKKALACKLAKAMWHVMNGSEYDEVLMFG